MAEAHTATKRLARTLNIVHNDEIWKDHVRRENISARHKWPETWGYLVYEYRKLNCELEGRPVSSRTKSSYKYGRGSQPIDGMKLPVIPERQRGFPRTTSQEIGWKSTQNGRNSEMVHRYGEQTRGKCTILRRLNWPKDGQN